MPDFRPTRASSAKPRGLTRAQVARQLGVSEMTVDRMRRSGELHPERDANGVWWYQPADVVRAAIRRGSSPRSPGELAAAAFQMFDQGAALPEVVVALQLAPEDVRRLYVEFTTPPYTPTRP